MSQQLMADVTERQKAKSLEVRKVISQVRLSLSKREMGRLKRSEPFKFMTSLLSISGM